MFLAGIPLGRHQLEKPWSSTRSCQIATAFRPRPRASTISSRYGSQALALGAPRGPRARRVGGHRPTNGRFCQRGVGGHLDGNGRFCRPFAWPPAPAHREPGGQQITASRRAVHTGGFRDPSHRPAQAAESKNLLLLLVIQDVAHSGEGPWAHRLRQRLGRRQLMAGSAVSINGWIWVSTEVRHSRAACWAEHRVIESRLANAQPLSSLRNYFCLYRRRGSLLSCRARRCPRRGG